jgi:hypothetical protein
VFEQVHVILLPFPQQTDSVSSHRLSSAPRTVSNDTRVRADGLVKIMAKVRPAKGLNPSSRA